MRSAPLLTRIQGWKCDASCAPPAALALAVEAPLCLFILLWGIKPFARYQSQSASVAAITEHTWRTTDCCYIFYGVNAQLASVLLATRVEM